MSRTIKCNLKSTCVACALLLSIATCNIKASLPIHMTISSATGNPTSVHNSQIPRGSLTPEDSPTNIASVLKIATAPYFLACQATSIPFTFTIISLTEFHLFLTPSWLANVCISMHYLLVAMDSWCMISFRFTFPLK